MNKFKQPIIFEIEGTSFEVDIDREVLRQTNDQNNVIAFIQDMQDRGDFYRLKYDLDQKCAVYDQVFGQRVKEIIVPQMTELDPEGMAAKFGLMIEQVKGRSDFEVIVDQQALEKRLTGVLPQIDIAGEKFVVDLRLQELRHAKYFFPVISLKSFELTNDGWNYEAYYHPVLKQVVDIDPKLTEFPENVIKIKLPNEIGLDPVGAARQYGMEERELLRRYPIQKELKAELISLADTQIPELIRKNKEQLQRDHQANARRMKPRQRPRM
jgi:hypothetical protein